MPAFPPHTRRLVAASILGLSLAGLSACASGPTTKAQVCSSYNQLGAQLSSGNGYFGNPLFKKTKALGDVAERYNGPTSLAGNAKQLHKIASSDSVSIAELESATYSISRVCGHELLDVSN